MNPSRPDEKTTDSTRNENDSDKSQSPLEKIYETIKNAHITWHHETTTKKKKKINFHVASSLL
jgi:hypothetical protein